MNDIIEITENINTLKGTGDRMRRLVKEYHADAGFLDNYTLVQCFDYIKDLPYIEDPKDGEYIQRPAITLNNPAFQPAYFRDCDDKMIAMACCLVRRGVKFKFVAVSECPKSDVHHVIVRAYDKESKEWVYLDCTYPENEFGLTNTLYKEVLI